MIKGLGTDIIEVARIEEAINKHGKRFLDRVFTHLEQEYCYRHKDFARHFAGRFAAKEAIVKAFGVGLKTGVTWLDMEIFNDACGKPRVRLCNQLASLGDSAEITLSISHCRSYATSVAILSTSL